MTSTVNLSASPAPGAAGLPGVPAPTAASPSASPLPGTPGIPAASAATRPARLPLRRPQGGRIVGGVCLGVAAHLDLPVRTVRVFAIILAFVGGAGVLAYLFLWTLVPTGDPARAAAEERDPALARLAPRATDPAQAAQLQDRLSRLPVRDILIGLVALVGASALIASRVGVQIEWSWVLPVVLALAGLGLAWSQLDETQRGQWLTRAGGRTTNGILRLAAGLVLALVGVLLLVSQDMPSAAMIPAVVAALAVLAGAALVLAPWWLRLGRELGEERAARERANERADIAAHLHDSVLQTLALIQRSAERPGEVTRLARNQERELREWLYTDRSAPGTSLAADLATLVAEVENTLTERSGGGEAISVDTVVVGDAQPTEATAALLQATREALVNAVVHGRPPVSLYLEVSAEAAEIFVRDRGEGFDLETIPRDRLGVRESILGRVQRRGGEASVRSSPGRGTEVRLRLPLRDHGHPHGSAGHAPAATPSPAPPSPTPAPTPPNPPTTASSTTAPPPPPPATPDPPTQENAHEHR